MAEVYTGKLNICLDCEYCTPLDKAAESHSHEWKHFVFQDLVRDLPLTAKALQSRREFLKSATY